MFQLFRAKMSERPKGEIFEVATNPVMSVKELKSDPTRVERLLWLGLQELASGLIDFIRQSEEKAGPDQHVGILLFRPVCLPVDDPARQEVGFSLFQYVMAIPVSSTAGGCREIPFGKAYLAESPFHREDPSLVQSPDGRAQISVAFYAKLPEYLGLENLPEWKEKKHD